MPLLCVCDLLEERQKKERV